VELKEREDEIAALKVLEKVSCKACINRSYYVYIMKTDSWPLGLIKEIFELVEYGKWSVH